MSENDEEEQRPTAMIARVGAVAMAGNAASGVSPAGPLPQIWSGHPRPDSSILEPARPCLARKLRIFLRSTRSALPARRAISAVAHPRNTAKIGGRAAERVPQTAQSRSLVSFVVDKIEDQGPRWFAAA